MTIDVYVEGYGIIDGDRIEQKLASCFRHGYRLAGVHNDGWSRMLLLSGWWTRVCLSLGTEPKDGIDVEQLDSVPTRLDLSLSALRGRVGEKPLDRLILADLSWCVGQHQIDVETFFIKQEVLYPFHGKE
jgi:hypothetical protein